MSGSIKYTIGLVNWHRNKYDGILQEIAARLLKMSNTFIE